MKSDQRPDFDNSTYPVVFLTLEITLLLPVKLFHGANHSCYRLEEPDLSLSGTHQSQLLSDGFKTSNRK